jgi:hypothetical protein
MGKIRTENLERGKRKMELKNAALKSVRHVLGRLKEIKPKRPID